MSVQAWGATDVGNVKVVNEDSYLVDLEHGLFIVADGVSGKAAGEVASQSVVDIAREDAANLAALVLSGDAQADEGHRERVFQALIGTIQRANSHVFQLGKQPEYDGGMATTVVALLLGPDSAFVAHVGDSRVYLRRQGKIFRITEDHTYAEALRQQKGLAEQFPPEVLKRYEHVLTRSIGGRPTVDVDVVFFELQPGDSFLLCTDGLTDYVTGMEILDFVQAHPADEIATRLVAEAKVRGGRDNITAVFTQAPANLGEARQRYLDTLRKIHILESIGLFKELTQQELLRVLRVIYEQTYKKGDPILAAGDKAPSIFVIVEGSVSLTRQGKPINQLGAGEHFGELSLIQESVSSVDVHAAEDSLMLAISLGQFESLVREDATLGNKLLWNLMRQLARHFEKMNLRVAGDT
jgi:serine/threonine protein phosphatase PrpC